MKMKILFCVLSISSAFITQTSMNKLKHFVDYANAMPEYPANDTTDWSDPDYTSFQKTLLPTLGKRIVDLLGFKLYKIFPVENFVRLLQDATIYRERVFSRGRLVQKMTPEPGSSFIIWGELNGAFHSLLRCLNQLVQQGVIDDSFKIIKPLTYFVFNGDVAHRSPYVIETLTLVLLLMERNPKKVFYLKGQVEDKQEWMTGTLGREMLIRARALSDEKVPFADAFRRFFGTLPLALYLIPHDQKEKEKKIVRISFFGLNETELEESAFSYFFDAYSKPVISLLKKVPQETDVSAKVVAYISAEDRSRKFASTKGLSLLSRSENKTLWTVLSSPTASFRRLYQFFDDAFVVLNIAEQLEDWTLTLYHQDVREMAGFIKERPFYLISGKQIEDKHQVEITELQDELTALTKDNEALQEGCSLVKKSTDHSLEQVADQQAEGGMSALQNGNLVFGSTMDLSKQLKNYSGFLKQGLSLAIDKFNKAGGLDGIKLQLIYLDDGYEPKKARANVEKLLSEFKTNVTLGSMGAPTLGGYIDLIKDKKILVIFPNTGSFRDPNLEYLLHLRVSYFDAGRAVTDFVIERNPEAERFAFLYQDDKWGQDLLDGAKQALSEAGIKDLFAAPYTRNDSGSFQNAAQQIAAFKPDAVGFFGAPRVVQTVMKELNGDFLASKILFGDTALGKKTFMDFIKEKGLDITIAQAAPNPKVSDLEIVQEFRKYADRAGVPIDVVSLEGYITGQVFLYLMDQIKDDLSIENFIKVVEATKGQDFKGLKLNFNPNNRQLLHTVWMNTGDEWIERNVKPYQADKNTVSTTEKEEPVDKRTPKKVGEKAPKESEKLKQELKKADTKPLLSIHEDILDIGTTMDLSKGVKSLSTAYKGGISLKINQLNLQGGINGLRFKLNVLDDGYEPDRARSNVLNFFEELDIDLLLAPVGTPTFKAYVDMVKEGKFLVLFPSTGSSVFRNPELTNVIHYRPSLAKEAGIITRYIIDEHKSKKIAIFYQDDYFGREPSQEIKRLLKEEYKNDKLLVTPYKRNDVSFKDQVDHIKEFDPDTIGFAGTATAIQGFIRQIGTDFLFGKTLYGVSWVMDEALIKFLTDKGLEMNIVSVMPNPATSDILLAKEFTALAERKNVKINATYFEGFFYMALFAHVLEHIEGTITKGKIIKAFENMKNFDFKGIELNFDPKTREILKNIWIYTGPDKPWVQKAIDA